MRISSELSKKAYLQAMKGSLESRFDFSNERLVGTVIGPFFSVAHCAGHEWNRKITDEKNRAIGVVRTRGEGTEVIFLHMTGMTNPVSLIGLYALCIVMFAFCDLSILSEPQVWVGCLIAVAIIAVVSAVGDSLTERGQQGFKTLMKFLYHPENFARWQ